MFLFRNGIVILLLMISPNVSANEPSAFTAVQRLFAAMSAFDYPQMKAIGTNDFHLLENGEVWDMDDLVTAVKPAGDKYVRRNYFSVIRTVTSQDSVWISYWNRADFPKPDGKVNSVTWLESAVMVNVNTEWKIQMMHSTRLAHPEKLSTDIIFEEYTD